MSKLRLWWFKVWYSTTPEEVRRRVEDLDSSFLREIVRRGSTDLNCPAGIQCESAIFELAKRRAYECWLDETAG